jgi:hypothetical protein
VCALCAFAEPASKEAFGQFKDCWEQLRKEKIRPAVYENCWRRFVQSGNIGVWATDLRELAEDGLKKDRSPVVRRISVDLIGILPGDESRKILKALIDRRDPLQGQAAQILLKWGDWDAAAPALLEGGFYTELADDPRGIPLLYQALQDSNLMRQITAAEALYTKLDKTDSLHQKARDVLAAPDARRDAAVTKMATDILIHDPSAQDIFALTQIVMTDTVHWSKLAAFGAVVNLAFQNNADALEQLRKLSADCPDSDLRSRARSYIKSAARQKQIADSLRAAGGAPSDSLNPSPQGTKTP